MDDAKAVDVKTDSGVIASSPLARFGDALAPWKPGQSGNPAGRPKDEDRLVSLVLKRHPGLPSKAADELARILGDGDHRHWMAALREWLDRTEGTVQQSTHHHVSTDRAVVVHQEPAGAPMPELPGSAEPELPDAGR